MSDVNAPAETTAPTVTSGNPKDLIGVKKISISKIPSVALAHEAHALMDGAGKYGPFNWREYPVKASVYIDAMLRHTFAWFDSGEETASDSGVHHLGHARGCLAILLDAQANGTLIDDRPSKSGSFAAVAVQLQKAIEAKGNV